MNEHETIADIIAAMRDEGHTGEGSCLEWVGTKMRYYADRLEAAHRRERAKIEADALAVGGIVEAAHRRERSDAAKLREALEELVANIEMRSSTFGLNVMVDTKTYLDAKSALAAPPRNCDVGTAEEQVKRMDAFCARHGERMGCSWRCDNCPLCSIDRCDLVWAQMSYEEGDAK